MHHVTILYRPAESFYEIGFFTNAALVDYQATPQPDFASIAAFLRSGILPG